jgi:hypothetical protein
MMLCPSWNTKQDLVSSLEVIFEMCFFTQTTLSDVGWSNFRTVVYEDQDAIKSSSEVKVLLMPDHDGQSPTSIRIRLGIPFVG